MIHWARKAPGLEISGAAGWSYSSLSLEFQLARLGLLNDDALTALHFGVAGSFNPIPGKRNVLFTMWESEWQGIDEVLPVVNVLKPDAVLTPCDWNTQMLRCLSPNTRVETCPLGYDPEVIGYQRRRWAPRRGRFRILYLGAPNFRKYTISREVYSSLNALRPKLLHRGIDVEFYWKVTGACSEYAVESLQETGRMETVEKGLYRGEDWVVDNRFLDRPQIEALYHSAHLFLALHGGEGFGLNALEAMVSGCPLVVTDHSGTTQFAKPDNAWLVGWDDRVVKVAGPDGPMDQRVIMPRMHDALERITAVMADYYAAAERAKVASRDVATMTWAASASRIYYWLREFDMIPKTKYAAISAST